MNSQQFVGLSGQEVLLGQDGKPVVACDVGALATTDLGTVEALCRLTLIARQLGCGIRIENASDELRELLELTGLADVVRCRPARPEKDT